MIADERDNKRVRHAVLLCCALAWTLLVVVSTTSQPSHGGWSPTAWWLMLVAMMSPVLAPCIQHARQSSFQRRRGRATVLFLTGYLAVWTAVGAAFAASLAAAGAALGRLVPLPLVAALLALMWQLASGKQLCLNRCRRHRRLAPFGLQADASAFQFGLEHGLWCVGSCWALMLFPMTLERGHLAAMAAVTLLVFSERLEHRTARGWHWFGFRAVARMIVARARSRNKVRNGSAAAAARSPA